MMGLRRLSIATRIALVVAVPTLALVSVLAVRFTDASSSHRQAQRELAMIDALEALTAIQANMQLLDLVEVRAAVARDEAAMATERAILVDATLDAAWARYMPIYLAADDGRATLAIEVQAVVPPDATDAFDRQRVLADAIIARVEAGDDVPTSLLDDLREARLTADLALTDLALASGTRAWTTYPATVEVSRATALEFGHLVPALLGVRAVDVVELATLDGRRANATERVVFHLNAERRAEVDAVFASADYGVWADARDHALAVLAGDAEPWSLLEVTAFSGTAISLGEAVDAVSRSVGDDVRLETEARAADAAGRQRTLLVAIAVITVGVGSVTTLLLRSILAPLRRLTARTSALSTGDLTSGPVDLDGRDELTDLASVIEEMAGALTHLDLQVRAISDGRLDDPSLDRSAPGLLGSFVAERVEALRLASEDLADEANRDALTGLRNRRGLEAAVDSLDPSTVALVLFVDLDRFKSVNDDFGHRHGDAVLREVAGRITTASRGQDVVARIGGDEFVVVAVGLAESAVAQELARRLELSVRRPIEVEGVSHHIGCSVGMAWVDPAEPFSVTLERADLAMIAVKREHRDKAGEAQRAPGPSRR